MKLLVFILFSFLANVQAACEPTADFSNFVRTQNVFSSDNPKKEIETYALKNQIKELCAYEMISKLVPAMAVEWTNRSRELGCFEATPALTCPDQTKNEIFSNIDLLEQWSAWMKSNKVTLPEISLCHEFIVDGNIDNFFSNMTPVLTALKKEERMKIALDLQKMNCNESSIVTADNSPNLEYFKELHKKGMAAPIDDFLKLWYPNTKDREDDPYFFKCQDKPWAPLTKAVVVTKKHQDLVDAENKANEKFNKFLSNFKKLTPAELDKRRQEHDSAYGQYYNAQSPKEAALILNKINLAKSEINYEVDFTNISEKDVIKIQNLEMDKAQASNDLRDYRATVFSYLPQECKPDVLYSWGPSVKLDNIQKTMTDGKEWSSSPNPRQGDTQAPLFMSMSPASTFAYGDISIRLKVKPSVSYKQIPEHVGSGNPQPKEIQVRIDQYQDFTTNDASVIESWSYGTPEHYDEIIREILRFKENKRAQLYTTKSTKASGIDQLYGEIDGYKGNEKNLKQRLLAHIEMIIQGKGRIFFQKGSCRNRELSFKTKRPTYFNPR